MKVLSLALTGTELRPGIRHWWRHIGILEATMKGLLRDLLDTEAEAQRVVAEARARAAEVARQASEEAESCRRGSRSRLGDQVRTILEAGLRQSTDEEERILAAAESEIAAIGRRFRERRTTVAEVLARRVLPTDRNEG
jgi:vacuolar-type H+-ATPase subunit H